MIAQAKELNSESPVTQEQLAHLGGGSIAYVKPMLSDEVQRLFPQITDLQPGLQLFALVAADGTPIMLTDSKDAAIANAWEHQLQTVSVH